MTMMIRNSDDYDDDYESYYDDDDYDSYDDDDDRCAPCRGDKGRMSCKRRGLRGAKGAAT